MKEYVMKRGNITGGLILILLGAWFLAVQFIPGLSVWADGSWPLWIIGLGAVFLLVSVLNGNLRGLSIPAFIIGGIGGLLYYQNATGDWASWAYVWTFIPGFVGLGLMFFSLQSRQTGAFKSGATLLFLSAMFFFIFGSFLGAPKTIVRYWPLLLVVAGLWSLGRALFAGSRTVSRPKVSVTVTTEDEAEDESAAAATEEA
jgi:hypothetical protein